MEEAMAIYRTASFHVRPENLEACKERIRQYVAEIKAHEPGTRMYVSLQDQVTPNRFLHIYVFDDEAAEIAHGRSAVTKQFSQFLSPELAGPVSFGDFDVVAET
jgi:quinol monooxygenase YgiN